MPVGSIVSSTAYKDVSVAVARNGYAFVPSCDAELTTASVAERIGKVLALGRGSSVHQIVPQVRASPNSYSGIYGTGAFPMHTDMAHWHLPPRYLLLRCVRGHEDVKTLLVAGGQLHTTLG